MGRDRHNTPRNAVHVVVAATRIVFSALFLLSAILPSIASIAVSQSAVQGMSGSCHRIAHHGGASFDLSAGAAQSDDDRHDYDVLRSCVCILCLTPASPNLFGDMAAPFVPSSREMATLSFATGVSATSGPRKVTNFATGPPLAAG